MFAAEFVWGYIEDYGTVHDINILWESEIWTYEPEHIKVYGLRLGLVAINDAISNRSFCPPNFRTTSKVVLTNYHAIPHMTNSMTQDLHSVLLHSPSWVLACLIQMVDRKSRTRINSSLRSHSFLTSRRYVEVNFFLSFRLSKESISEDVHLYDRFHRSMTRPFFSRDRVGDFHIFERHADIAIKHMRDRLRAGYAVDIQV